MNEVKLINYVENQILAEYDGYLILVLKLGERLIKCFSSKNEQLLFCNEKEYKTKFKDKALSKYIEYLITIK